MIKAISELSFQLLGPIRGWRNGTELTFGTPKQRAVLAILLLKPSQTVRSSAIVDTIWGAEPPRDATNTVHVYVSRIRRALRQQKVAELVTISSGYRLDVPPEVVDLHRFNQLVSRARSAREGGRLEESLDRLQEALALWREDAALADLDDGLRERINADSLNGYRRGAVIDLADTCALLHRPEDALSELEGQATRDPTDEPTYAHLMLAYAASGRRAAALKAYEVIRAALAESLGVDPSDELKRAHLEILRQ